MCTTLLSEDVVAESKNILLKRIYELERNLSLNSICLALKVDRLMNRYLSLVHFLDIGNDAFRLMISNALLLARTLILIENHQLWIQISGLMETAL